MVLLCLPLLAAGQEVPRKAERRYHKAMRLKLRHKDEKATRLLHKLMVQYPAWTEPYSRQAQWYSEEKNYPAAAKTLATGVARAPNGKKLLGWQLAQAYLYAGNYQAALQYADTGAGWEALRRQIQFLQSALPAPAGAVAMPMHPLRINTRDAQMFPQLSADGHWLYYAQLAAGAGVDADLYRAERDSCGGWLSGRRLSYPVNTGAGEQAAMVSADRHYLFFTRCDRRSPNGVEGGGCDLFMAYTVHPDDSLGASWSVPQSFGLTINTPAYEGEPCLSADNRELFFVSDRAGGYGGKDIYVSRFEDGRWQLPRNLGPTINSAGDDTSPFMHPDGETFYFSSTGHPGFGKSDIFISRRLKDTVFTEPQNLGLPYNSIHEDFGATVNLAGDSLYWSSDRHQSAGDYDLYEAWLSPKNQSGRVSVIRGFVRDSLTAQQLNYALIYFRDSATGKRKYQVQSNRGDGSYTLILPQGHTWFIETNRISYSLRLDTFRDAGMERWPPAQMDFPLLPAGYQKPTQDSLLMVIYFQKNKVGLEEAELTLLSALPAAASLPDAMLIVNGYTDNSGTPMLNEQLSTLRAQLVRDVLIRQGADPAAVLSHGWGEASPLAPNDTEENRDRNRRVEVWLRW